MGTVLLAVPKTVQGPSTPAGGWPTVKPPFLSLGPVDRQKMQRYPLPATGSVARPAEPKLSKQAHKAHKAHHVHCGKQFGNSFWLMCMHANGCVVEFGRRATAILCLTCRPVPKGKAKNEQKKQKEIQKSQDSGAARVGRSLFYFQCEWMCLNRVPAWRLLPGASKYPNVPFLVSVRCDFFLAESF